MLYAFGECTLDDGLYEIHRAGTLCHTEPQVFGVLLYLLQNRSRVVPKEELLDAVWGDGFITEATVNSRIMAARKAIGDDGQAQHLIKTVRGRGFRFVGEVRERSGAEPGPSAPAPPVALAPPDLPAVTAFGRQEDLNQLQQHLAVALTGRRQVAFVTGEAGIGKTTLLQSFLQQANAHGDCAVLQGQCLDQHGAGEAYMPLLSALDQLCRGCEDGSILAHLKRCAPTWLVQMPWLLEAADLEALQLSTAAATRERMLREIIETLESLTTARPLILVLEDLHWSDHSTLDLLPWLARRATPARLMIIGTYRSADARASSHPVQAVAQELRLRGHCHELALSFLGPPPIAEYLQARFPGLAQSGDVAAAIHRRTGGNPLFMHHLVEAWRRQDWLVQDGAAWKLEALTDELTGGLPADLRQLIEQQIEQLDPQDQKLLEAASVVGAEFAAAAITLHKGTDTHHAERRCAELARQRLFLEPRGSAAWPDGTLSAQFGFTHHLYAEVLYERIPAGQRAWLHCQIGDRLEAAYGSQTGDAATELALHFLRGRDAARAVYYLQRAAGQAMARNAHREGVQHLQNALGILPSVPEAQERARLELDIQRVLAPALVAGNGWMMPEAEAAHRRARELSEQLGDPVALASAYYALAFLHEVRGEYQQAQAMLEQHMQILQDARQLVPEAEKPLLESHELLSCSLFHQGFFQQAVEHADEGLNYYEPAWYSQAFTGHGENAGVGCHLWAALALWYAGYPDQAMQRMHQAADLACLPNHDFTLASVSAQSAILHQLRGEVAQVAEQADATLQLARENGFPYRVATGNIMRGWALAVQGAPADGIALLREGLDACQSMGALYEHPYYLTLLADAYAAAGNVEEALRTIAEAQALMQKGRCSFYGAELDRIQGELLLLADPTNPDEARALFQQAIDDARATGARSLELRAATSLCRLAGADGQVGADQQALASAYNWFTEGFATADLQRAAALLQNS